MAIVYPLQRPRTNDPKEVDRFFRELVDRLSYLTYAGNPTGNLAPRFVYDQCLDTTNSDWFMATGLTNTDWEQITFAAGTMGDHGTLTGLTDDDHTQYLKEITPTTDNAIVRWSGAVGAAVENSGVRIDDNDDLLLNDSDKVRLGTGQDCDLYHDGTNNLIRLTNGELQIGGAANYTAVEVDGTLEFNGDATVWEDKAVVPGSFDRPGISDPTIVAYDVNGGGVSTYLWQFDVGNVASFTVQIPHSYKQGSDIYVHIHWTPGPRGNEEADALVGWKVDYSWANIDGTFGTMATADLSDACDGTDHKHQMTREATITGTDKTISSMLICNVKRTDTGDDDTWAGTISGQRPLLLEIDFHFELDSIASRARNAK